MKRAHRKVSQRRHDSRTLTSEVIPTSRQNLARRDPPRHLRRQQIILMTGHALCVQEMLFSVREKLKKGEVVTGADVEEFEDVEQTTAGRDHTQSGWKICEMSLRKSL